VKIEGGTSGPFGVLVVQSMRARGFAPRDVDFLQSLANVPCVAGKRHGRPVRRRRVRTGLHFARAVPALEITATLKNGPLWLRSAETRQRRYGYADAPARSGDTFASWHSYAPFGIVVRSVAVSLGGIT
jgi:hypothetical protein